MFIMLQIFFATCGNLAGIGRICHSVICQSRQSLSVGFQNLHVRFRFRSKAFVWGRGKTFEWKVNLVYSVNYKSKIQVADKVTGNLTVPLENKLNITKSEKLQSIAFRKKCKLPSTKQPELCRSLPLSCVQLEQH